ncbi:MAG: hypothetical protein ACI8UX_000998 [Psychromonas sp.]
MIMLSIISVNMVKMPIMVKAVRKLLKYIDVFQIC